MKPKEITKGSTLLATIRSEFNKGEAKDLEDELHSMIAKAMNQPTIGYRIRRDTLKNWQDANPIIEDGQLIAVLDSQITLCGDGEKTFQQLYNTYITTIRYNSKPLVRK